MPLHRPARTAALIRGQFFLAPTTTIWRLIPNFDIDAVKVEVASGGITLLEPAGVASGDWLVACIASRGNAVITLPAGWSLVATQQSSGNISVGAPESIASAVMACTLRGASAPSFAFSRTAGDVALGAVVPYRGQAVSPYDTGSASTLGAGGTTASTGTITTAENEELLVAMVAAARNTQTDNFVAATGAVNGSGAAAHDTSDPAGNTWKQRANVGTATGGDVRLSIADAIMSTAGATGSVQATMISANRAAMILGSFKKAA